MEELLTTIQAAQKIGLKPKTLHQWRSLGRGPRYVKLGFRVFYKPSDLAQWVDSRTVDPAVEAEVQ